MVAATYAWLLDHSALSEADGVLLGASSVDQLDACLDACANIVDLPDKVRDAFDGAWAVTRPGAAPASFWSSSRARRRRDPPFFAAQARSSTGGPTRRTCLIKRVGTRARPTTRRRRSRPRRRRRRSAQSRPGDGPARRRRPRNNVYMVFS